MKRNIIKIFLRYLLLPPCMFLFIILIPILGALIGSCVGAGIGAWLMERRSGQAEEKSVRIGIYASLGTFAGTVIKSPLSLAIWLIAIIAAIWP